MRHLILATLMLVSLALTGCWSFKTDANTKATPKKKTALFSCPATGPCLASTEASR